MRIITSENVGDFHLVHVDEVSSTMDVIGQFELNTVLCSNVQTGARGKGDRVWDARSKDNLYFSLVLASDTARDYSQLSFLCAIALLETVEKYKNRELKLTCKWPNDLLLNQKKMAGILLEHDIMKKRLVIGIGVNLAYSPVNANFPCTNLEVENGIKIDKIDFLKTFLAIFATWFNSWKTIGFKAVRKSWLANAHNLGKEITVKNNGRELKGIFKDLAEDGSLILETADGVESIASADIF